MNKIKEIEARWKNHLMVLCAFRYCLGKESYIVSECTQWLCEWWHDLADLTRKLIIDEANAALENNIAGDILDQETWKYFLAYIKKEAAPVGTAPDSHHHGEET